MNLVNDLRTWLQDGLDDLDAGRRIDAGEAFARVRATLQPLRLEADETL
jgi:hypothetical protein